MNKRVAVFLVLMSMLFGLYGAYLVRAFIGNNLWTGMFIAVGAGISIFFLLWQLILQAKRFWNWYDSLTKKVSLEVLAGGMVGLVGGVALGFLLGYPFLVLRGGVEYVSVFTFFVCGLLGVHFGTRRARDLIAFLPRSAGKEGQGSATGGDKVLDTSAIIDGRIYDVALSGFLEGCLVVPRFVIEELRHIADSSDFVRRSKGRRGLDILAKMQKNPGIQIKIHEGDFPEEKEVDMKLLRLCRELNACIVTNDYNLNKVAELQGVKVLNVNDLTNAVKVVVFPGETLRIAIIRGGKEEGQGVGYLEDGTMVVVEGAEHDIGQEIEVIVTSVFQTSAGRMIFSRKAKDAGKLAPGMQKYQEVKVLG